MRIIHIIINMMKVVVVCRSIEQFVDSRIICKLCEPSFLNLRAVVACNFCGAVAIEGT